MTEEENPFDHTGDIQKAQFFREMSNAMKNWMIKKYPDLNDKLTISVSYLMDKANQVQEILNENQKIIEILKKENAEYAKKEIKKFMQDEYPDFSGKLSHIAKQLEKCAEKNEKDSAEVNKNLKKIITSNSLCEDIYKLKDEVKDFKKTMDEFKRKMGALFK